MNRKDGWALTETICEIIDDEMARSPTEQWAWDSVRQKVVERSGLELDVDQAIWNALNCEPVGTNVGEDGTPPDDEPDPPIPDNVVFLRARKE